MAIYDYLPTFNYIEPNNLKGLQPGFVVAQMEVASSAEASLLVTKGTTKFMENGTICSISADGIVEFDAAKPVFICFSEPLNTLFNSDKFYAVNVKEENPRLVQLIPGDEWMACGNAAGLAAAIAAGVVVEITSTSGASKDDFFKCSQMANGDAGKHYMYVGK